MSTAPSFPLEQLAELSEVPERQIRELVRLRLLPAPSSGGRGATYGTEHLDRLRAWKALKRKAPAGTTNDQFRILLDKLSDSGLLRPIADGKIPFNLIDDQKQEVAIAGLDATSRGPLRARESAPSTPAGLPSQRVNKEALAYLSSLRRPLLELGVGSSPGLALDRLRTALEEYVAQHAAEVRVKPPKTETWQRVIVGRDLEISARGPLRPDEVQLLETIGQLLQQAIYRKGT